MLLEAAIGEGIESGARRGCLLANSTCELGNADPEVLAHAHDPYETTTALIADCVSRAQDEGDLPAESDPVALARAVLAAQQGIVVGRSPSETDRSRPLASLLPLRAPA
jgi:hypothetical protein